MPRGTIAAMPVIYTHASTPIPPAARESLKATFGQAISLVPGKSESWLMVGFEEGAPLYFQGNQDAPTAFVDVSIYGRGEPPASAFSQLTPVITQALGEQLGIPAERIYIKYTQSEDFGWNGANF